MGGAYSELGCFQESVELLGQAIRVMGQIGDRFRQGIFYCAQARSYIGLGSLDHAQICAEEALKIFDELGNDNWSWQALEAKGMAALERYDLEQAQLCFEQSLALVEATEEKADLCVRLAYLALVYLYRSRSGEALRMSRRAIEILSDLRSTDPGSSDDGEEIARSREVYFIHFRILAATRGSEAARPFLERAYNRLSDEAGVIDDPELRHAFLTNIPLNREISAAHESGLPPPVIIQVRLAAGSRMTNQQLRTGKSVQMLWTLIGPGDGEIRDKVERRRRCLLRLIDEAASQGVTATVSDLASVLKVDQRTIKRDLAALRASGNP
jgi:tetratricopeptide (TPR) repeat protein